MQEEKEQIPLREIITFKQVLAGQKGVSQSRTLEGMFQADVPEMGRNWGAGGTKARPVWLELSEEAEKVGGGQVTWSCVG